ncbi:hypothetical protein BDR04DRAFT_1095481 [Suillus decipiens]|nr:hypothetical protein BDR04DRAFT_1095481 [Suillus decipiens]
MLFLLSGSARRLDVNLISTQDYRSLLECHCKPNANLQLRVRNTMMVNFNDVYLNEISEKRGRYLINSLTGAVEPLSLTSSSESLHSHIISLPCGSFSIETCSRATSPRIHSPWTQMEANCESSAIWTSYFMVTLYSLPVYINLVLNIL